MAKKPRIPKSPLVWNRRERDGMDPDHLIAIRNGPCCCCGRIGVTQAHHLRRVEGTGMGKRAADKYAIPLCGMCHSDLHDRIGDEEKFLADNGIDGPALAAALWALRTLDIDRQFDAYRRVVFTALSRRPST